MLKTPYGVQVSNNSMMRAALKRRPIRFTVTVCPQPGFPPHASLGEVFSPGTAVWFLKLHLKAAGLARGTVLTRRPC